ncbi:uncharacterized protein CXQ87_001850 [Candidozyma duobushaemuli]|uniref:DNA 3'-5' helicase n=1 Tax=Candidozyma duobushaemuli TaxID=1231522 RepID=A0A2V1A7B9_9ASCO|nr:uncharacterized protein CXQ87_001850 [[Candida] duobushaemulonis]PVH13732.1 hypothetical protein CXQ87_001850 [[Candida] duobushaemulonis]
MAILNNLKELRTWVDASQPQIPPPWHVQILERQGSENRRDGAFKMPFQALPRGPQGADRVPESNGNSQNGTALPKEKTNFQSIPDSRPSLPKAASTTNSLQTSTSYGLQSRNNDPAPGPHMASTQLNQLDDLSDFSDSESLKLIDTKALPPLKVKPQTTLDQLPRVQPKPVQPEPVKLKAVSKPDNDVEKLQAYIRLCEEKINLLVKRHSVNESTSLSLDAKNQWVSKNFANKFSALDAQQSRMRAGFTFLDPLPNEDDLSKLSSFSEAPQPNLGIPSSIRVDSPLQSSQPLPRAENHTARGSYFSVQLLALLAYAKSRPQDNEFERNKEEARQIIMETRRQKENGEPPRQSMFVDEDDMEDDFGEEYMDGLRSSQADDRDTDLSGFIAVDDVESIDDTYVSPRATQADSDQDESEIEDSAPRSPEGNDMDDELANIKLSQDVAERYGLKYNTQPGEKTDEDNQIDLVEVSDEEEEANPMDFTTQLNEARDEIVEIPSEDDMDDEDMAALNELSHTRIKVEPNQVVISDEDFSDDDDELLQLSKSVGKSSQSERTVLPGSEKFINEVYDVLEKTFKLKSFRPNQLEVVCSTLNGKDVFVLIPTGGGKSLCYQLPALVRNGKSKGTTLVISPLISLMQDQVQHLLDKNIRAGMISSKGSSEERNATFKSLTSGQLDLVYLSPEMVNNSVRVQKVLTKLYENDMLARVVVDEAHCVSSWGHDFRPDYKGMSMFKQQYPTVPVMALTATANEKVRLDIVHHLRMSNPVLLKQSFNRTNLFYEVKSKPSNLYEWIRDYIMQNRRGQTGIIYCHSKQSCETTSQKLNEYGIRSMFYHAGMDPNERFDVQTKWQHDELQLICATIAFGMGIDKPDVRFVIHMYIPRSLEGYYQETGRAGRDGEESECIMFYSYKDARSLQSLIQRDDKLEEEARESHLSKLKQVVQYCENKSDCRRKQVLHFFNEEFDPKKCNKKCDNCCSDTVAVVKDVTEHCQNIVKLVQEIQSDKVTTIHCQDVYRGSRSGKILKMGHHESQYHGLGNGLDRGAIERIFFHLQSEGCLLEYQVMKGGFASSYVKLGPNARPLMNGSKRIKLSFAQADSAKKGERTRLVASGNGNGLNTFRYQDSFVSAREMRNQEQEKENLYQASKTKITLPRQTFNGQINANNEDAVERAFGELRKIRHQKSQELRFARPNYLLGDDALKEMAIKLPTNARDFGKLDNISKDQAPYFQYFKKTLGALARERKKASPDYPSQSTQGNSTISEHTSQYFPPTQKKRSQSHKGPSQKRHKTGRGGSKSQGHKKNNNGSNPGLIRSMPI